MKAFTKYLSLLLIATGMISGNAFGMNNDLCDICHTSLHEAPWRHILGTINLNYSAPELVIARCNHKFHAACILKKIITLAGGFNEDSTCPCCPQRGGGLTAWYRRASMQKIYEQYQNNFWVGNPDRAQEDSGPEKDTFITDHKFFTLSNSKFISWVKFHDDARLLYLEAIIEAINEGKIADMLHILDKTKECLSGNKLAWLLDKIESEFEQEPEKSELSSKMYDIFSGWRKKNNK